MVSEERPGGLAVERVQSSSEQVAAQLRTSIVSQQLQRAPRLPSERELATEFGVSRSTVREALRLLSGIGAAAVTSTPRTRRFLHEADGRHRRIAVAIADRDDITTALEMRQDIELSPNFHLQEGP
jgi:DNA-binding FadR family transcriptional regulator